MRGRDRTRAACLRTAPREGPVRAFALALALAAAACAEPAPTGPPNIVLVFADDLGWKDLGATGSDFHETPHLDQLAREGIRLDQAYAAASNCLPSRASLLSGQYTPRHGVLADRNVDRGPARQRRLQPLKGASELGPDVTTLAEALRGGGYATAMFGKWQVGRKPETLPPAQGFDVGQVSSGRGSEDDPKGIFAVTRAAGEFLREHRDRPMFVYVAHHAIHRPLRARAETLARFEAKTPGTEHGDPLYAANLYDLDAGVGELLDQLDALDLSRRTLVVVTSDNGADPIAPQSPLRGTKGTYYEGGIRVPLIARWPGVIAPGTRSSTPVIAQDLYPTFLAAAGVATPADVVLDGVNLVPLLEGGALEPRALFWHFPNYLKGRVAGSDDPYFRTRPVSVIRKGDWKLHLHHEPWALDGGRARIPEN
nr:sulfatase [Myxococcota bacterium]